MRSLRILQYRLDDLVVPRGTAKGMGEWGGGCGVRAATQMPSGRRTAQVEVAKVEGGHPEEAQRPRGQYASPTLTLTTLNLHPPDTLA